MSSSHDLRSFPKISENWQISIEKSIFWGKCNYLIFILNEFVSDLQFLLRVESKKIRIYLSVLSWFLASIYKIPLWWTLRYEEKIWIWAKTVRNMRVWGEKYPEPAIIDLFHWSLYSGPTRGFLTRGNYSLSLLHPSCRVKKLLLKFGALIH